MLKIKTFRSLTGSSSDNRLYSYLLLCFRILALLPVLWRKLVFDRTLCLGRAGYTNERTDKLRLNGFREKLFEKENKCSQLKHIIPINTIETLKQIAISNINIYTMLCKCLKNHFFMQIKYFLNK